MFSNAFVSLILAVAVGGWIYAKSARRTGGNKQSSMIAGGAIAVLVFIVCLTLLSMLFAS